MFFPIVTERSLRRANFLMQEVKRQFGIPSRYLLAQVNLNYQRRAYSVYWDRDQHHRAWAKIQGQKVKGARRPPTSLEVGLFLTGLTLGLSKRRPI